MSKGMPSWIRTLGRIAKWTAIGLSALLTLYLLFVAVFVIGGLFGLWPLGLDLH